MTFGKFQILETGLNVYIDFEKESNVGFYVGYDPDLYAYTSNLYMHDSQDHRFIGLVSIYDLRFL